MANNFFYYLAIASFAMGMASCNKEESPSTVYGKAYPVILKAQSIGLEADKAPEAYTKGEGIGVSLLETGTDNVVSPNSNICYLSDGIGYYFVAEKNESAIYLPESGEKRDVATYYPRVANATDKVYVDLTTDQKFGALLQYGRINGLDKDNREAELKMKNALSLVTMDIDASLVQGATGITAILKDTPIKGNMSIYSGKLDATEFGTLTMQEGNALSRSGTTKIKKFFAMVIPAVLKAITEEEENQDKPAVEAKDAKIEIVITKGQNEEPITVEIKLADYTETLESAMNSNFNVSVDNEGNADVKVTNTSFSINDWGVSEGIDVDGNESLTK